MAYCAGDMREHITLMKQTAGINASGFQTVTYTDSGTLAAKVASVSGKDFAGALANGAEDVITFTLRWTDGITTADRIAWEGTTYEILAINLLGARRDYMNIKCRVAPR